MEKKRVKHIILMLILSLCAVFVGYIIGNAINAKFFVADVYADIEEGQLFDDISKIKYSGKTPDKFSAGIVFQIADQNQVASTKYTIIGEGTMATSLNVTQEVYNSDSRNGNQITLFYATCSKLLKVAKKSTFTIGGDIQLYDGKPSDTTYENTKWTDKHDDYTWEGYKETFGKYANINSSLIVSTKTILSEKYLGEKNGLYTFEVVLDNRLGAYVYVQQIAANLGVNVSSVSFTEIKMTFSVDKNFNHAVQTKHICYSLPFMGVNVKMVEDATSTYNFG